METIDVTGVSHSVSSKQPQLLTLNPWRAKLRKIKRREFAVEAVAAGEGFKGGVDLIRAEAGAFHAAAELGVVKFAGTRLADGKFNGGFRENCHRRHRDAARW